MTQITGWGRETWGSAAWDESVPVELTGISLQSSIGISEGKEVTVISPAGFSLSANLNNVITEADANIVLNQSLSLSINLGNEESFTDVTISLNGFSLTAGTITPVITAWQIVNKGSESTWTPVDLAA